ncbi:MAG: TlpA disulfide reductase family protein [Nocardioidaceae bacterium]
MSRPARVALISALALVLTGAFLWKFGGTTGAVQRDSVEFTQIQEGWAKADEKLPETAADLPALGDAAPGIPSKGTYLVNIWGSWCDSCKKEMPWLERFANSQHGVGVIGISRDLRASAATDTMRERGVTYPNVQDEYGDFVTEIGAAVSTYTPSSFIVKDGVIIATHTGVFKSYDALVSSVTSRA